MDTTRLKELVQVKDKAKASKADRKEFYDGWLQLIREDGPTEEAFELLLGGFVYTGMEPFAEYLKSSEDMQKTVIAFLHSAAFSKNSSVAFKCALNLLACLIRDVEMEFATCAVIMRELPRLSMNKKKQLIADVGKIFAHFFYCVIYAKHSLPSLGGYGLNEKDLNSFILLLQQGLEQSQGLVLNEKERMGRNLSAAWIALDLPDPARVDVQPVINEPSEKTVVAGPAELAISPASDSVPAAPAPVKPIEAVRPKMGLQDMGKPPAELSGMEIFDRGIKQIRAAFEKMQEEILNASAASKGSADIEAMRIELQKRNDEIERLKAVVMEKDEMLTAMDMQIRAMQNDAQWMKAELDKKDREISDRIEMSEIVRMDNERVSDQQLKRIGSELSTYYQDILESGDVEMTAELGEILRDQIMDVFAVLKKNGIQLDQ